MLKKLRRYTKRIRNSYSENGIAGVYDLAASKAIRPAIPLIYKNKLLSGIHHPELKIVYLELTNNCNLRCKMCNFQQVQEEIGYMTKSAFESYVDQLCDIGIKDLYLHLGGESLLHPEFKDFLKYAINKRDQTEKIGRILWATNGMLFDQSIADLVVNLKVDAIIFSLDGVGQVNDKIRLGSNYSIIEKNIKYLLEKRGNSKKPFVQLYVTDYGKTEEQKMEIYREWVNLVDQITLVALLLPDNTIGNKNIFSKCQKICPPFCEFPFKEMGIRWDGKVTACVIDYAFKMALGDATKVPIKQIWNSSEFKALRNATSTNSFPVGSPCFKCEFWQMSFVPLTEPILDGKAKIMYGDVYTKIQKAS
jgi:MoaA/NifB/PqqE/SkfB family radical SAM enzyme